MTGCAACRCVKPGIAVAWWFSAWPSKARCSSGGCHGKAAGQNGFKLSLLGFEPQEDFEHLVRESRGRRVSPASPAQSLLLRKALNTSPHGGGQRLESDSHEYRMLRRWIAQGLPYGDGDAPGFFLSGAITFAFGWSVYLLTRFDEEVTTREGFAIVTMAWTATAVFGSLPYLFTGVLDAPVAAVGFAFGHAVVFAPRMGDFWVDGVHGKTLL